MYTMKETCEKLDITYETLKFYCNKGLIPNVGRNKNNHRVFTDKNIAWIKSLFCLKNCGLSIKEMKEYVELCLMGKETIQTRKEILKEKRKSLVKDLKKIQESIDFIDSKQKFYDDVLSGKIEYISNLTVGEES